MVVYRNLKILNFSACICVILRFIYKKLPLFPMSKYSDKGYRGSLMQ